MKELWNTQGNKMDVLCNSQSQLETDAETDAVILMQ